MGKFETPESQEYRDNLADKLKDIRGSEPEYTAKSQAKALGYLEAKQEEKSYKVSESEHQNAREAELLIKNGREYFIKYSKDAEKSTIYLDALKRLLETGVRYDKGEIDWYMSGLPENENYLYDLQSANDELEKDDVIVRGGGRGIGRGIDLISKYFDVEKFRADHPNQYKGHHDNEIYGAIGRALNLDLVDMDIADDIFHGVLNLVHDKTVKQKYYDERKKYAIRREQEDYDMQKRKFMEYIQKFKKSPETLEAETNEEKDKKIKGIEEEIKRKQGEIEGLRNN